MTGRADRPAFPARRIARRRLRPLRAGRCKSEVAFAPSDLCNNDLRLAACGAKRPCVNMQFYCGCTHGAILRFLVSRGRCTSSFPLPALEPNDAKPDIAR